MSTRTTVERLRPWGLAPAAKPRRAARGAQVLSDAVPLQPREAPALLDHALDGLVRRAGPCLGLVLLFWLPFRQFQELLGRADLGEGNFLAILVSGLATQIPSAFALSVVTSVVGDALSGGSASIRAAILRGLRRAPGVFVIVMLTQVATLPLALCFLLPYFVALWLTWAAVPLYVLEGEALSSSAERARVRRHPSLVPIDAARRIVRAIRRSIELSTGWSALGRWLLLAVVGLLLLVGSFELTAAMIDEPSVREFLRTELALGGLAAEIALATFGGFFLALASSVRAALMTAYYLDLRVRREGLDLELALRELASRTKSARVTERS